LNISTEILKSITQCHPYALVVLLYNIGNVILIPFSSPLAWAADFLYHLD